MGRRTWQRIERFFLAPASPKPLGLLRIAVAGALLLQAWMCREQFYDFYGSLGILQNDLSERYARNTFVGLRSLARYVMALGLSEKGALGALGGLYVVSLVALLAGFFTRFTAFVAWALHLAFAQGHFTGYGFDLFSHFALFYALFMPMGQAYSVDQKLRGGPVVASWQARLSLRVWQIHLAISYLASGIEKAGGEQWRNGEAVWRSVMMPLYRQLDLSWLASVPWLVLILAWGTLIVEIGYPFFIFPRRTRPVWVALTVSLHVSIGIFLGLHLFALLMAVLTVCCFALVPETEVR